MPIDHAMTSQFYRSLLDLRFSATSGALEGVLQHAVAATGARVGYLELWNERAEPEIAWVSGSGDSASIQTRISRRIISKAILDGHPIVTTSAVADARLQDLGSVRQHQIRSVWCAPIPGDDALGILYFEGNGAPFTSEHLDVIEFFVRELEQIAGRIVARSTRTLDDRTTEFRATLAKETLQRHDWNVSSAARELCVTRKTLYRLLRKK
ncbi:MAG: GAF domain-containing protein [Kofleriaceae bacterium]